MVDKAELRIGNFVRGIALPAKYLVVTGITNNGVYSSDDRILDFETIEPIALTDEILVKSGFIYGRKYCFDDFYDFKKQKITMKKFGNLSAITKIYVI